MKQRGDTIIEVLFAVTVFSMIAVGGLSLMNQGTAMAQRSLEIGLVRDQMDTQADALRYLHNAYIGNYGLDGAATATIWNNVTEKHRVTKAQDFGEISNGEQCQLPPADPSGSQSDGTPFVLDIRKLDSDPVLTVNQSSANDTPTYAQVRYPPEVASPKPEGIWMQVVHGDPDGPGGKVGFYDFHIRACWLTPGQHGPVTLGTIVRLYDPAP